LGRGSENIRIAPKRAQKLNPLFLVNGFVIGFSIAAPVGPIGLLCIQRTLARGRLSGFVTGLGAATADAVYASMGAFGLAFVATFLVQEQFWLRLIGGAFLIFLGVRIALRKAVETAGPAEKNQRLASDYGTTVALTLTNPSTIISFAAIFAGLGLANQKGDYSGAAILVAGVFAGSTAWWLVLSSVVSAVRHRLSPSRMRLVNLLSGALIVAFGVVVAVSLFL